MEIVAAVIKVVHIVVSVLLIITVLIQPGKGDNLGSIFGGGTSQSIFGASGAAPFLTKLTRILALCFIITSLSLAYFATRSTTSSVVEEHHTLPAPGEEEKAPEESVTLPEVPIEIAPQSESSITEGQSQEQEVSGESASPKEPEGKKDQ